MNDSLILPCASCGTLNRVPRSRLSDVPVCSDCRAHLLTGHPVELGAATFEKFTSKGDLPVLVDFWAPWCGPCRTMAPHFEAAAKELETRAMLAKVDTEQHPQLAQRFGIQGIPTIILFRGGREVARQSGALVKDQIVQWVLAHA